MKKALPLLISLLVMLVLTACAPDGPGAFRVEARDQMNVVRADIMDIRDANVRVSQLPVMRLLNCDRAVRVMEREISFVFPDGFVQTQFWRAFDLIEDDALDFDAAVADMNFPEIFMFFDYQLRTIDMASENCARTTIGDFTEEELFVYSHEFVNAAQSVELDLRALRARANATLEGRMAANALSEGDATITADFYLQDQENAEALAEYTQLNLLQSRFTENTPPILQEELLFSYTLGTDFAQALYDQGVTTEEDIPSSAEQPEEGELDPADFQTPWDVLNQAYSRNGQPASTEQIIHPDRYLDGDAPLRVDLVDVDTVLDAVAAGSAPPPSPAVNAGGPGGGLAGGVDGGVSGGDADAEDDAEDTEEDTEGEDPESEIDEALADEIFTEEELGIFERDVWVIMRTETLGEFYLRQHLATQLDEATVDTAATGWGGDEYIFFYNGVRDEHAWVLRVAWDTPEDMDEFIAAYADFANARQGSEGEAQANGAICWTGDDGALCTFTDTELLSAPPPPAVGRPRDPNPHEMVVSFAPTLEDAVSMIDLQLAGEEDAEEE